MYDVRCTLYDVSCTMYYAYAYYTFVAQHCFLFVLIGPCHIFNYVLLNFQQTPKVNYVLERKGKRIQCFNTCLKFKIHYATVYGTT